MTLWIKLAPHCPWVIAQYLGDEPNGAVCCSLRDDCEAYRIVPKGMYEWRKTNAQPIKCRIRKK